MAAMHIGPAIGTEELARARGVDKGQGNPAQSWMETVNDFLARLTPVSEDDKVTFFRLMATMINAGISITKALRILESQTENAHFKRVVHGVTAKIESGTSFSEALAAYGDIFSEAQIGMVESGEATGRLNQTLLQIATETEKSSQLSKKIRGAMIYPITILAILFVALYAVMTFVMPKIKDVFSSLGSTLPAMTQLLIDASDFMQGGTLGIPHALWILGAVVGLLFGFSQWKKTGSGRMAWAQITLRMPVFGTLFRKTALARFCRSLSTLTGSGVSIVKALYITAGSVGNPVYERRIRLIAEDVKRGITLGENMKDDERHFPAMVVSMISVAEQTAQVDPITAKLADFYEEEVDDLVKNLSRLMEPLIIVVLGLTVGFLVIAVMLPILQSSDLAFGGAQGG